ncbi:MAG: AsmA family protein [Alphaproteobacteria bacterium]|nr:MAG: AsmA family protein [Alphaproteobacteria bacterium]
MKEDDRRTSKEESLQMRAAWWRSIHWSRVGMLTGGITVLLVAVLLIAPSLIDWTPYRDQIAALASRASGLEIRLDGPISLHLLPRPAFRVEKLSLGADAPLEANVGALEVVLDWGALTRGRFAARTIRLIRPRIRVDDPLALNRWWAARSTAGVNDSTQGGRSDLPRRFEVAEGRLLLAEPQGQRFHRFDIARLSLLRARPERPWRMVFEGALDAIPVNLRIEGGRRHRDGDMAIKAAFDLAGTTFTYTGRVRSGARGGPGGIVITQADGKFEVDASSPAGLIAAGREWSGYPPLRADDLPRLLKAPIRAQGHLLLDGSSVRFEEIRARLDKGRLDGRIALDLAPFALHFDLECDSLELADLLVPGDHAAPSSREAGMPLELSARWQLLHERLTSLPGVLEGKLTVRALHWRNVLSRDARLALTAGADERLDLRLGVDLPGGGHADLVAAAPGPDKTAPVLVGTLRLELPSISALKDDSGKGKGESGPGFRFPFDRLDATLGWRWRLAELTIDPLKVTLDGREFEGRLSYAEPEDKSGKPGDAPVADAHPQLSFAISGRELSIEPAFLAQGEKPSSPWTSRRLLEDLEGMSDHLPPWRMEASLSLSRVGIGALTLEDLKTVIRHRPDGRFDLAHLDFRRGEMVFALDDGRFEIIEGNPHLMLAGKSQARKAGALVELLALDSGWKGVLPEQGGGRLDLWPDRLELSLALEQANRRLALDGDMFWDEGVEKTAGITVPDLAERLPSALASAIVPPDRLDLHWQVGWQDAGRLIDLLPPTGWRALLEQAARDDRTLDLHGRITGPSAAPEMSMQGSLLGARTQLELVAVSPQRPQEWKLRLALAHADLRRWGVGGRQATALPLTLALEGTIDHRDGRLVADTVKIGRSQAWLELIWQDPKGATPAGGHTPAGPRIALDIEADRLDLDELGLAERPKGGSALAWPVRPFEEVVPASWQGEGRIGASAIRLRGEDLADILAEGTLHDGRIDITTFRLSGFGGKLKGEGRIGLGTRREIDVHLLSSGLSVGALLPFFGAPNVLAGKWDGEASFSGSGESVYDLVSHLEGRGMAEWKQPALIGVDLDTLARNLAELSLGGRGAGVGGIARLIAAGLRRGRTGFSDSRFEMTVSKGVASIESLRLASRESRLETSLDLDLPALRLEGRGSVRLLPLDPKAPALSFRLEGPLGAPELRWNSTLLERWLVEHLTRRVLPRLPLPPTDDPTLAPPDILAPHGTTGEKGNDAAPSPIFDLFENALQRLKTRIDKKGAPESQNNREGR